MNFQTIRKHTEKTIWAVQLLLLLLAALAAVQAQSGSGDKFDYIINPDNTNTITIVEYTGNQSVVTIPTNINNLLVTAIGNGENPVNRGLTSVTIPSSVTIIATNAFFNSSSLTNVVIGDGVETIGVSAFQFCSRLAGIAIPGSVDNIRDSAFYGCYALTNVNIPSSITKIGEQTFALCTKLTAITVDSQNAFYSSLDGVLFDKSQTTLVAYPGGMGQSYAISGSVATIGNSAFFGCTNLVNITIGNGVTTVGNSAFNYCLSLSSVTLPVSVINIGDSTFSFCSALTNITIPDDVTNIGDSAFEDCSALSSIIIPRNVTTIGDYAFYGCGALTGIVIPGSVTSIGTVAFTFCSGLTNISIPSSVTNVGDGVFDDCSSLTAITVDAPNEFYSSTNGVLFNKSQTTLLQYPPGRRGSYTIPNSVTNIEEFAFTGSAKLPAIVVPGSVISVAYEAFVGCADLTSVTIANGVTSIGEEAFEGCVSLTNVTIAASVTNIGASAFYYCSSLTGVYFWGNAPSLSAVMPGVDPEVFGNAGSVTVYYLPGATGWNNTFDDRPTALWLLPNPLILTNDPSFGMQSNGFGFTFCWATNVSVWIQACTNLANPSWKPLQALTLTNGSFYFSDPQWTNYPARFYRISPP